MEKQSNNSTDKLVSINWQPNPKSSKAMHKQIVDYISAKVANGDWTVGSKLPPQRELAKIFGVNRSTIINAMETLKSYGIIDADYGGGTRIACNTWSLLMSAPPDWNKYIASGPFKPNLPTIQLINKLEFDKNFIRLGTGELSPQLFPQDMLADVFRALPAKISSLNYLEARGLSELRKSRAKAGLTRYQRKTFQYSDHLRFLTSLAANFCRHAKTRCAGLYGNTYLFEVTAGLPICRHQFYRHCHG